MRPGGIQDASSANELYSPVDTDPEDPVIGKKQLPMPAKRCLRRSDREKLRRVSVNQTKVLKKLDHAVELLSADPPVCTSAGFFSMLCDSIIMIREDRAVIWQFLGKNEDNGTSEQLRIRAQRHLANAEPKLAFVDLLRAYIPNLQGMLDRLQPICTNDDLRFIISLR